MLIGEKNKDIDKYTDFYLSGIYAHGKLELVLGIDYLYAFNQKFFEDIYNEKKLGKRGRREIDTKVIDNDGNELDVRVYLWNAFMYNQDVFIDSGDSCGFKKVPVYRLKGLVILKEEECEVRNFVHDAYIRKLSII